LSESYESVKATELSQRAFGEEEGTTAVTALILVLAGKPSEQSNGTVQGLGPLGARLGLGQADARDLRIGVDRARHRAVVDDGVVAARVLGRDLALAERRVRELPVAGAVADGVDVVDGGAAVLVRGDSLARVEVDTELLEAEVLDLGRTPDGDEHQVGLHGLALADRALSDGPQSITPEMLEAHYGVPMLGAVLNTINTRLDAEAIAKLRSGVEIRVAVDDEHRDARRRPLLLDPKCAFGRRLGGCFEHRRCSFPSDPRSKPHLCAGSVYAGHYAGRPVSLYELELNGTGTPDEIDASLSGELDLTNARELEERLRDAAPTGSTLIVDLNRVVFIDSAALHELFKIARHLETGSLVLVLDPDAPVARTLEIVGMKDAARVIASRDQHESAPPA
jgi:anti-anti-sigma factor